MSTTVNGKPTQIEFLAVVLVGLLTVSLPADEPKSPQPTPAKVQVSIPAEGLVLARVGVYGRRPFHTDALEARIVTGKWTPPKAGDQIQLPDSSTRKWETIHAGADGSFAHSALNGGYCYFRVNAPQDCVRILEAAGHGMVYVNGEPRAGDPYEHGYVKLPVRLLRGSNDFLFHVGRGHLRAKLVEPKAGVFLDTSDVTLPDLVKGQYMQTWGSLLVVNATTEAQEFLVLYSKIEGAKEGQDVLTMVPSIPPMSVRKVTFSLKGDAPAKEGPTTIVCQLLRQKVGESTTLDSAVVQAQTRLAAQTRKETFVSGIDASIQYFAIVPAKKVESDRKPALVLTLHGAAVEALGQAQAYAAKDWAHIVAPTNRRPYGFDWEDWGRLDAMEVLDLAQKQLRTDPARTYLTGHSMGGHGTWHLGVTFPDRFAAIGPSAGWVSMWSYAGAKRSDKKTPMQELLDRAMSPSDTLALARNTTSLGVYVLHGDKDDNVPVAQARIMKQQLSAFHKDLQYFEEPGAGHWWGKANVSGSACVDWPPMFDFFARHEIPQPKDIHQVDFVTASPGVSARCHWATIECQTRPLQLSSISIRWQPDERRFSGTTDNVGRLMLDLDHLKPGADLRVEMDGQKIADLPWPGMEKKIWLERVDGKWSPMGKPAVGLKGPHRYGPFKEAFRNRMQFVYGTQGTAEENAWAFAKARFDAETFWYRGNGSIDVIPDSAWLSLYQNADRNVILYGNAASNRAWKTLLADCPLQVSRGFIRVGDHEERGDDLCCLFLYPRPHSEQALVGVVSGSGPVGMPLTDRLPYFISGVGYPDWVIFDASVLKQGVKGVRGAGYFSQDWGLKGSEVVWR
jgi:poly(3-hydroxybutyrate) depolymerase